MEKRHDCIKIKNIIFRIINLIEINGTIRVHVTDPWDPLKDIYENMIIENAN
jgi:hypothetical protein